MSFVEHLPLIIVLTIDIALVTFIGIGLYFSYKEKHKND